VGQERPQAPAPRRLPRRRPRQDDQVKPTPSLAPDEICSDHRRFVNS
jgi:hypothetical protein